MEKVPNQKNKRKKPVKLYGSSFYIRWQSTTHGHEFITTYGYDGTGHQSGYSFHAWRIRCINAGKREGFTYLGGATPDEWINQE